MLQALQHLDFLESNILGTRPIPPHCQAAPHNQQKLVSMKSLLELIFTNSRVGQYSFTKEEALTLLDRSKERSQPTSQGWCMLSV
jgi:hypothetical protein